MSGRRFGLGRVAVALVPAGVGGVLAYSILRGLGASSALGLGLSTTLAAAGMLWLSSRLSPDLDATARRRPLVAVLWLALGFSALAATARLAAFMVDETRTECSMLPFDDFFVHHSCLSAHYQSARLQREGVANVYERTHFEGLNGEPKVLDSFVIDVFIYPPPFLLLSRSALALSEDFGAWRAVWFGLEGTIVAAGLIGVALSMKGSVGRRALMLTPLVWLSVPLLTTLQIGNFHLVVFAGSMLAMLALERRHHAMGGAVLAALTLGKVFPGILVLLLIFERRWRSVAWTAAFGVLFLGLSWAVLGDAPFRAMVSYNLPRLASGAALETQFAHPDAIAASHAIYGFVQKLSLLGVPGTSQRTAVAVSWLYTAALLGFAALGARSAVEPRSRVLVWLALLQLASLRSPFTPDTYAQFPIIWILVLLLAGVEWRGWRPAVLVALILLANYIVPTVPIMPLPMLLGLGLIMQLLFFGLCVWVLVAHPGGSARVTDGAIA